MKHSKKYLSLVVFICLVLTFSGCKNNTSKYKNYDFDKSVFLCDYRNIVIEKNFTDIDEDEMRTIINLDFSSNNYLSEIKKDTIEIGDFVLLSLESNSKEYNFTNCFYEVGSKELSEEFDAYLIEKQPKGCFEIDLNNVMVKVTIEGLFVLPDATDEKTVTKFYGMKNMQEVENYLKARAYEEIVYNYMWDYILDNSIVKKYPKELSNAIADEIDSIQNTEKNKLFTNEYLEEMGTTLEEMKKNITEYYFEMLITDALLNKEKIVIDDKKIEDAITELSEEYEIEKDEVYSYYTKNDIYYYVAEKEIRNLLISVAQVK